MLTPGAWNQTLLDRTASRPAMSATPPATGGSSKSSNARASAPESAPASAAFCACPRLTQTRPKSKT